MRQLALAVAGLFAASCARPADQWTFRTKRPFILAGDSEAHTPVVTGDVIFACGGYFWNGWSELVALTAATGEPRWRVQIGSCKSSPVVIGSTVVALASQEHGTRHSAYGVDARSGRTLWTREFGEVAFHAAIGDVLYVTTLEGPLRRVSPAGDVETIDLEDGSARRLWMAASPAALWFGSGGDVWRIAASDAKPARVSTLQAPIDVVEAAATDGDRLVLQDRDNRLTAFAPRDGRVLWTRRFSRLLSAPALLANPMLGSPSLADARVFVNTFQNGYTLQALDAQTGSPIWSAGDGSFDRPTASDGRLYVAGRTSVMVIDRTTGRIAARIPASGEVVTSPVPAGNLVVFGTIDGAFHAVRVPAGR